MVRRCLRPFVVVVAIAAPASLASAQSLQSTAPATYDAVTDRSPRAKPALTWPGIAGSTFVDPTFGSLMRRITDRYTRPGSLDRSYRTPSGSHQNAWSADGRLFYVVSTDGTILPFTFDPSDGTARRVDETSDGDGGLVVRFYIEPIFSYVTPGVLYGSYSGSGATRRTIDQFDFATGAYARLLDLDTLAPDLAGTYIGAVGSSSGPVERIMALFGGVGQDQHYYLTVFDKANPQNRWLLNTKASTINGVPTAVALNFMLHAAAIDRSGRYVTLYPTGTDRLAPRNADPNYLWDIQTNVITPLPSIAALSNGHDAYGYGVRVNQDCCVSTTWDAAQWQLRYLSTPLVTRDVVAQVLTPKELYLSDHPSWHNAAPDRLVPYVSATYRYYENTVDWRAWDDEIIAVQTGMAADAGADVWRFAHHRSDVRHDLYPTSFYFWYTPRANVSPDGRWVLFTSNWEKTLGTDPAGELGGTARQDVFLVALTGADSPEPPPPPLPSAHIADLDATSFVLNADQWRSAVVLWVHTEAHTPVAGAVVTARWSDGYNGPVTCKTDMNGRCKMLSGTITNSVGSLTFTVTDITAVSLPYLGTASHDPDTDSNGTVITIRKP